MKPAETGMRRKNILAVLGTRPEAIKLAPVILALHRHPGCRVSVCNTEQQAELSRQALEFFGLRANFNLDVMRPNQTLAGVQARMLTALSEVYANNHVDATMVQGDTMTVFCGALVSFYHRIPLFHVEAGLRSHDLSEPFPEEALRQMVSRLAALHFAPTPLAYEALLREKIDRKAVVLTGNTVIDALSCLSRETISAAREALAGKNIELNDKLVLVTAHRRENHGERLGRILAAIADLAKQFAEHQFVLPVHPNPNVRDRVRAALGGWPNAVLTEPLAYPELVCLMKKAKLILTDSGGIQEEAPTFGVPVLVMRYETERTEGVAAGLAKLVGADYERIMAESSAILSKPKKATRLEGTKNPYGDGHAARKILEAMNRFWDGQLP